MMVVVMVVTSCMPENAISHEPMNDARGQRRPPYWREVKTHLTRCVLYELRTTLDSRTRSTQKETGACVALEKF